MNANSQNPSASKNGCSAEETLRLIASLPAPEGLENRIHEALRSAPRRGVLLDWPGKGPLRRDWMRAAAAAAIAFVITGGGWGVYTRVQQGQPARVIVMPAHGAAAGSFSGAGAIRMPQTLNGPVLEHAVKTPVAPAKAQATAKKTPKKAMAQAVHSSAAGHPAIAAASPQK